MTSSNTSARNFIPMANKYDRVVLLVDMDCFYCQVEEKLDPSLKNQPLAVVQYNAWRGGGIIAVNYAARAKGVTRHMRGDEAKEQCPEIQLVKVPNVREKADLTKYREAGKEVASVLQRFTPLLERASVDEAYLDLTCAVNKRLQEMNEGSFILQPQELASTYVVGFQTIGEFVTTVTTSFIANPSEDDNFYRSCENDDPAVRQSNIRLLIGASIANEIRRAVKAETSYECSAGIAHNKILAKLACGINKPNKQTILPLAQISRLFETLPVGKIKGLGAKFGEEICERLSVRYLGQMLQFTEAELQKKFDEKNGFVTADCAKFREKKWKDLAASLNALGGTQKDGVEWKKYWSDLSTWLYNICRGIDLEAVTPRFYSKSIGCCKKFPGRNNITGIKTLQHWLKELANEINERLTTDICENNRRAKQMVVNFLQEFDGEEVSSSRSAPLQCYDTDMLAKTSLEIIKANTKQFFRSGSESVLNNPIKFLGISVGKFETISNSKNNIQEMFAQQAAKKQKLKNYLNDETQTSSLATNLVTSEAITDPKAGNESNTEIPKGKQTQNIKSFFLNALKKEKFGENGKTLSNDNNIVVLQDSFDKLESSSSNHTNLKINPPDALAISSDDRHTNDSTRKIPQKSFFANALRRKEYVIRKEASDLNLKTFDTNNSNNYHNPEREDSSCNDLILIQYEEKKNIEVQNENKYNVSSTNIINKSGVQISDVSLANNLPINMKRKHDRISDTEELNQTSYRNQYAEFALPEFKPEFLQFTNCSKCNTKIPNDPIIMQTHEDHHYAQQLSNQQRHEFRDEIRSKIISSKSPPNNVSNKKSKKVQLSSSVMKTSRADITKFLKPSTSSMLFPLACDQNDVHESSTSNIEICDICKLPIEVEKLLEHKDFHIAKELQRKLNQLEVHTVQAVKDGTSHSARKTSKLSMNMSTRHTKVTAKPITQFFTQSNM